LKTDTVSYKLVKKIKDDRFDVEDLHHYSLSIQIGLRDFQLLVTDLRKSKVLLLEDFILSAASSYKELTQNLDELFDSHHLLKVGFWKKVKISFKNNKFSLVPSALFAEDALLDYLRINANVDPHKEEIMYYKHLHCDAVNVFSVNKILFNWVRETYRHREIECVHQSSNIIEGVLNQSKRHHESGIFLFIDRFKLHVVATKKGKLQYYNQFVIKQFPDYMKYIMASMKGLGHDLRETPVVMWGYVGKKSPHFAEFSKYIKNLSFGGRPDFLNFGYFFDEVQDHHFFDLYGLQLCD
jgi:hypothetical protein